MWVASYRVWCHEGIIKMSWDVELTDLDSIPLEVPSHQEGGTFALGGTETAELNITYNYSPFYYKHIDKKQGLRWLDKKRAIDTVECLKKAIKALGTVKNSDYWNDTPGNAGYALNILLSWARIHPEGIWNIY